jgi:DNA-binding transcriptional ArsR family regulator
MNALSQLFSRTRGEMLRLLFGSPDEEKHLRELARKAALTPAAVQRELARLEEIGLVVSRRDGNRLYFRANRDHPVFPELHRLVMKASGVAGELRRALETIEEIDLAFIFGSMAAGTQNARSDIDVLAIGTAGLRKITPKLRTVADALGREINPFCMTCEEWKEKARRHDAFVSRLAAEPKLWLKGDPDELETMAG